jgi:hypothetical protein
VTQTAAAKKKPTFGASAAEIEAIEKALLPQGVREIDSIKSILCADLACLVCLSIDLVCRLGMLGLFVN